MYPFKYVRPNPTLRDVHIGIPFGFRRTLEAFNGKDMSFSILYLLMEKII